MSHSSDQCPTANTKVRELIQRTAPEIPTIAKRHGITIQAGPYVLASEHESVTVVESDRVEAVNDFVMETGLIQWNSVRVSLAQHLQDALGDLDKVPPALY